MNLKMFTNPKSTNSKSGNPKINGKNHRKTTAALSALYLTLLLPTTALATEATTDDTFNPADITAENITENITESISDEFSDDITIENPDESLDAENTDNPENTENTENAENTDNTVRLIIDSTEATVRGEALSMDVAPYAVSGTTMLPLRFIAQDILEATVEWDAATGLVRVKKDDTAITIDLAYGKVYSDGEPYIMATPPAVKDSRTFVPLRLITELMSCTVQYDPQDHSINITLPQIINAEPPVASITYQTVTAGQDIPYTDYSFDPSGNLIVDKEWTVTGPDGKTKTGSSLYWLFYTRQGGDYTISYRVKSETGLWSEPVTTDYHLEPNLPPEITLFDAPKTSVNIGETLNIEYDFTNEDWEDINGINFTYSWEEDGKTITKTGLPAAFFTSGKHTVKMRVQDAFGQWSDTAELTFDVGTKIKASEAEYKFTNLNPGEIYLNLAKYNFTRLTLAETTDFTTRDVTLLDSNSPEKVTSPGILYQDTVTGSIALHYHHLNDSSETLKFQVIATNNTEEPLTFTLGKQGFAGPSTDPMQVGYIENQNYLASQPKNQTITLLPGETYLLNPTQTATVNHNQLQSALIDLEANGNLTLTVAATRPGFNYQNYATLPTISTVGPQTRGTYQQAAYDISVKLHPTKSEKILLGHPESYQNYTDSYLLVGTDAMTGETTTNKGNYGLVQTVNLTATRRTGIILNPRGSIYRGALLWNDELCLLSSTGQIQTTQEGVILGVIEAGETVTITYITPDGSDSPVLLVSIPERNWSDF